MSKFSRILRNEKGATIIEFALVALPFFYFIFGIIEFGIVMFTYSVVEGATSMASRMGKTGYHTSNDRASDIRQEFLLRTRGFLSSNNLHICATAAADFGQKVEPCNVDTDNPPPISAGNGTQIVLYTVTYQWKVITPIISQFFPGGTANINAIATVKNEAF